MIDEVVNITIIGAGFMLILIWLVLPNSVQLGSMSLKPSMSGIRPQLQGPDEPYRDFVIKDEAALGYPALINLIGIECPGLTNCIPIAQYVTSLVAYYV